MTYMLCRKLIAAGRTEGLAGKVDIFFAAGRLTAEQYTELMGILCPQPAEMSGDDSEAGESGRIAGEPDDRTGKE